MKPLRQPAVVGVRALALTGVFLTGCLGNPNTPTVITDTSDPVVFSSIDLRIGTGVAAAIGDFLTIEFTGWLYDDTQPDNKGQQVVTTVGTPGTFVLGVGQAIAGFDQGLVGMREGGERRFIIPPALAFGSSGSGSIPPNATLVFDVELLRVDEAPSFTITDTVVGTGAVAANGDSLTVEYVGWLYDPTQPDNKGLEVDASDGTPFPFVLGVGQVIPGWEQGVVGMRVGGKRQLIIPPDLAYGSNGRGSIPPGATLVFDIELLTVG